MQYHKFLYLILVACGLSLTSGCRQGISPVAVSTDTDHLQIYPDYASCHLPHNIAPCNFRILTPSTHYRLTVRQGGGTEGLNGNVLYQQRGKEVVQLPLRRWKRWLQQAQGDTLWLALSLKQDGTWRDYAPFPLYIDSTAIAPYLTYRLIEPSYQLCNFLTIEERCLENFNTSNLYDNVMNDLACVNCHTSAWGDPNYSLYHVRFQHSGTYIAVDGRLRRIDLKSNRFPQGGVYPAWHPDKRYIAFGTAQAFPFVHSQDIVRRTEVFDSIGDIMVYDIYRNRVFSDSRICTKEKEETFPYFAPDGRTLYFCQSLTPPKDSATEDPVDYSKKIKYSLVSIEFNAETGTFGRMDTLVNASESKETVSFPRVSPDGRFLVFCLSDHGTFPVRHPESDLYILNLKADGTGVYRRATEPDTAKDARVYRLLDEANSDKTESYHEFSPSGGRWLMFSSKRDDGMYARPYFCLIDDEGNASKPFMLPQKDPDFYLTFLKSYNVPVFSNAPAPYDAFQTAKAADGEIIYPEALEIKDE
ncbi:MAG: hypothetical protein K2I84_01735 [Bacteroidales bacterium]|nr:hypothetical protein [Bacteroidales bacterium]